MGKIVLTEDQYTIAWSDCDAWYRIVQHEEVVGQEEVKRRVLGSRYSPGTCAAWQRVKAVQEDYAAQSSFSIYEDHSTKTWRLVNTEAAAFHASSLQLGRTVADLRGFQRRMTAAFASWPGAGRFFQKIVKAVAAEEDLMLEIIDLPRHLES